MPLTIDERNAAARALYVGALGLGESHDDPTARSFALELFRTRLVRRLMVELYPAAYQPMVDHAAATNGQVYVVALHHCAITLSDVINAAIAAQIPVHCVDGRDGNIGRASGAAMQRRNQAVGDNFAQITGGNTATHPGARGCLILFGGAHFEGANRIQNYIGGLPYCRAG
ncbi:MULTISPECIES: hypothetical protein [unclassified Niveibacterium]|uniref:hypothetical protein n=1 Tax=unclassified Niveibacterium TaxID=2648924 RepID=UPI0015553443|nr:hypothetical protein [Niveibacterium sp. COAC-50]